MDEVQEYPKMLYRYKEGHKHAEGCELLNGVPCETAIAEDAEEEEAAKHYGWRNSPAEALAEGTGAELPVEPPVETDPPVVTDPPADPDPVVDVVTDPPANEPVNG